MSPSKQSLWLVKIISFLVFCIASYVFLHLRYPGSEKVSLTLEQIVLINKILEQDNVDLNDTLMTLSDNERINKVFILIQGFFSGELRDEKRLKKHLHKFGIGKVSSVLESIQIEATSFFWLNSDRKYLEILYWSLIGVLTSLLYSGSKAIKDGLFNPLEQAAHLAKILYAPVVALVIILSADMLLSGGEINLEGLRYWPIVVSFVLGWFSGRAVELLNRIKNLVFPFKTDTKTYSIKGLLDWSGLPAAQQTAAQGALSSSVVTITGDKDFLREVKPDNLGNFSFVTIKPGSYELNALIPTAPNPLTGSIQIFVTGEMEGIKLIVS